LAWYRTTKTKFENLSKLQQSNLGFQLVKWLVEKIYLRPKEREKESFLPGKRKV
jgi:hypothetical protein